jgi:hypothetical protein
MSGITTLKIHYRVDGKRDDIAKSSLTEWCLQDVPAHRANSDSGCDYAWATRVVTEKSGIHPDRVDVVDIENIG